MWLKNKYLFFIFNSILIALKIRFQNGEMFLFHVTRGVRESIVVQTHQEHLIQQSYIDVTQHLYLSA